MRGNRSARNTQHTWDLSRATGQDDRLDLGFCAQLLGGMGQGLGVANVALPALRRTWGAAVQLSVNEAGNLGVR